MLSVFKNACRCSEIYWKTRGKSNDVKVKPTDLLIVKNNDVEKGIDFSVDRKH